MLRSLCASECVWDGSDQANHTDSVLYPKVNRKDVFVSGTMLG